MLTGPKVPEHKDNNVTAVLQFSMSYFAWHTQQSVAATNFVTRLCTACAKFPTRTLTE